MSSRKEIYEFANFRLDVNERTVERIDGVRLDALPDKTFETLVLLVRKHGHLVSKDDILQHVWPDTIVEENNLEKRIHQLRQFLGVNNGDGKYIETVRKHGYRFIAPVRKLDVSGSWLPESLRIAEDARNTSDARVNNGTELTLPAKVPTEPSESHEAPDNKWTITSRKTLSALGVAALLIVSAIVGYFGFFRAGSPPLPPVSILILPAFPIQSNERNDLYELGIADALINRLSAAPGLVVRSLNASLPYAAGAVDPVAAGRDQKVDYVLDSTFTIADGKVRVTSRLIHVGTGQVEGPYRVETPTGNVFAVHDAVASETGNKILAQLGRTTVASPGRGTSNEEAYRHYIQGMTLLDQRRGSPAEQSFNKAVALDPNFALAWAGKALAHRNIAIGDVDARLQYELTLEAANRALALDPTLADAYSALCLNKLQYEYDASGAEPLCKTAIEIDPRSSIAHHSYVWVLNYQQRHEEAIEEIKIAIDLEPRSFINQRLYANTLYLARRHEVAFTQYERLIQLNPNVPATYEWSVLNLLALGRVAEAYEWFIRSLRADKADEATIESYQKAYEQSGWPGVVRERLERGAGYPNNSRKAGDYARLGNKDAAFDVLNKMYDSRRALLPLIMSDPQIDPLRDDPRYQDLIRRINVR